MGRGLAVKHRSLLARGVALVVLGGLTAGCSSDVSRFQDSIFTGSVRQAPASQAFPGNLDHSSTGSVQAQRGGLLNRGIIPTPSADVGNGGQMQVVSAQQAAPVYSAPSGTVGSGPALAPVARSALEPSVVGTTPVQQAQPLPRVETLPQAQPFPQAPAATQQAALPQPQPVQAPRPAGQAGWSAEGGTQVTVRPGDTISALSRRYNVPEDQIRRANGITGDTLVAGRTITIPTFAQAGGPRTATAPAQPPQAPQQEPNQVAVLPQQPRPTESAGQAAPAPNATASPAPATGATYTVVAGDTLSAISRRTGVGIDAIRRANGLSDGVLRIGQQLVIPGGSTQQAQPATQVASAAPRAVDTVVTWGASNPPAAQAPAQQPVSSYTPPASTPRPIDVAALDTGAEAPDATGVGKMRWPARGRVVAGFGASVGGKANDGIDIAMPEGTSVRAAENGVVIYAGDGLREFGNTVLVRHEDGLVTVYGHASQLKVSRGDTVRRGQEIALSGMSGSADSPRLHFEVRKDSRPVDPLTFLE